MQPYCVFQLWWVIPCPDEHLNRRHVSRQEPKINKNTKKKTTVKRIKQNHAKPSQFQYMRSCLSLSLSRSFDHLRPECRLFGEESVREKDVKTKTISCQTSKTKTSQIQLLNWRQKKTGDEMKKEEEEKKWTWSSVITHTEQYICLNNSHCWYLHLHRRITHMNERKEIKKKAKK